MSMISQRPRIALPYRFTDYLAEIIATSAIVFVVVFAVLANIAQSQRKLSYFGIHFYIDVVGHPAQLILTPALLVAVYVLLTVGSRVPHIYTYPKPITAENAPRLYRIERGMMLWMKAAICFVYPLFFLNLAYNQHTRQNPLFSFAPLAFMSLGLARKGWAICVCEDCDKEKGIFVMSDTNVLLADLRQMFGQEGAATSIDGVDDIGGVCPPVVVRPRDAAGVAQALAYADARGLKVLARGSGTQRDMGNPATGGDILLSLVRLDNLIEHAPHDMTVTVAAGMPLYRLQHELGKAGQWLALDPAVTKQATVGGVIATNVSGSHRLRYGSMRDQILGVEVALADGTLARSGGKVVKNVAGYDLPKLFTGSLGTLGVITSATFRVYPLPPALRRVTLTSPDLAALGDLALRIQASPLVPAMLDLGRPDMHAATYALTLDFALTAAGIAEQLAALREVAGDLANGMQREDMDPRHIWRDVGDARPFLDLAATHALLKASVLPTNVIPWIAAYERSAQASGLPTQWRAHAGHGIILAGLLKEHTQEPTDAPLVAQFIHEMRAMTTMLGGTLVAEYCPVAVARLVDVWGPISALELMRRVKEQFDPRHTLNPGRYVGELAGG